MLRSQDASRGEVIMKNAIILAAGKSNRFAPFTYERPKALFSVKGEILIERQIKQLREANVKDIYIVVGYMKEKFFWLEQKYGVHLLLNNKFGEKGNLYSLYLARQYLGDTFLCCADHYFLHNPFLDANKENRSYRAVSYQQGKFLEFGVVCSDADVITRVMIGGCDSLAMVGPAYMNRGFSEKFRTLLEKEINDFGVSSMFWEEFYAKHISELTLYKKEFLDTEILEFECIDDLRAFDSEFLANIDSNIVSNICETLMCNRNDIVNIEVINAGLTNVSFSFECNDKRYVYRHPGGTSDSLIDRHSEIIAQNIAKKIEIDKSTIRIDEAGWKISNYIYKPRNCDFKNNADQRNHAMKDLRCLHSQNYDENIKIFDDVEEGKRLMKIASATKGNLFDEFSDIIEKVEKLYEYIKADADRLGLKKVLCHNDTYEANCLYDESGEIYWIDWEYAGLNYAANDIACILCRDNFTEDQIDAYLKSFLGRSLTKEEDRYHRAFIPIAAFYWFCWGLYKGSVGDDDGFFFLPAYRNLVKYLDVALESYENEVM